MPADSANRVTVPLLTPSGKPGHAPDGQLEAGNRHAGKVVIQTHGCKLNQADSSVLARRFRQAGYSVVEEVGEADIYVLNTCTVTATADAKARQSLRAARRVNPDAIIVAAGCYPQRAAEDLERMPAVSLVVGNERKPQLVDLAVAAHRQELAGSLPGNLDGSTGESPSHLDAVPGKGIITTPANLPGRSRGMVKIQEGCDQVCAYCIVPRVRGRERSIPPDEILAEIRRRISEGCQEVALTGTQLGTYGFDLTGTDLKGLLRYILAETDIPRLRVSSLQPQEIDEPLLQLWADDNRLCPHFHVPLQSGSDAILKAMRRRYDAEKFADTVALIRHAMPDAGITADLIAGFPGETETEFVESLAFAEEMRFSDMHIFPYSPRPGTSASYLGGHVAEVVKKERVQRALAMAGRSFREFREGMEMSTRPVLWEGLRGPSGSGPLSGLTDNYIRVEYTPGGEDATPRDLANSITLATLGQLRGKAVLAKPCP